MDVNQRSLDICANTTGPKLGIDRGSYTRDIQGGTNACPCWRDQSPFESLMEVQSYHEVLDQEFIVNT